MIRQWDDVGEVRVRSNVQMMEMRHGIQIDPFLPEMARNCETITQTAHHVRNKG